MYRKRRKKGNKKNKIEIQSDSINNYDDVWMLIVALTAIEIFEHQTMISQNFFFHLLSVYI